MEFSLVSKRGMPEDAIISIRSGATRRQGAVASDKPFRFPSGVNEADCVVKVDIMQTIGTGYLVMRPNQKEDKEYEVVMNNDEHMVCGLAVKPLDGSAPAVPVSPTEAAAAEKTKQDAKAYLESTGLLPFVQGVLQVVAKQQPEDPFAAMAKHFLSASDEAVAPKVGSPKAAPAVPKPVAAEPAEAKKEPAAPAEETAPASPTGEEAKAAPPADEQKEEKPAEEKPAEAEEKPAEEKPAEETPVEGQPAEEKLAEEAKGEGANAQDDEAEDHVDDNKSETLEDLTSKVKTEQQPDAEVTTEEKPGGAAAGEAVNDAGEAAKAEEPAEAPAAEAEGAA